MFIFKKAIPRRKFLRGMGATIALPLLDSMVPALSRADTVKPPVRFGVVYAANGMWPMDRWTPKTEGALELSPTLEPLAPFRDRMIVLSGLSHREAIALPTEGPQDHARASVTYLSGVRLHPPDDGVYVGSTTVDQIIAQELCKDTQLTSLELGTFNQPHGTCDVSWSCILNAGISWRNATTPLSAQLNPRMVFESLFGDTDSTDRKERLARIKEQRSVLDWLSHDASSLASDIGPTDRQKLTQYLDAVRDVERRIQFAEKNSDKEVGKLERPAGVPELFSDYVKLMFDLNVLVYQADLTRVSTFMFMTEGGNGSRTYPELGINEVQHSLSHHQNNPDTIEKLFRVNVFHAGLLGYFLEKLRATPEGDGNLLDHTNILYGSAHSNGNGHDHTNLPTLLVAGKGQFKGGRHLRYPSNTPMTNLHMTLMDRLGVHMDKLGDSTGKLDMLSV